MDTDEESMLVHEIDRLELERSAILKKLEMCSQEACSNDDMEVCLLRKSQIECEIMRMRDKHLAILKRDEHRLLGKLMSEFLLTLIAINYDHTQSYT